MASKTTPRLTPTILAGVAIACLGGCQSGSRAVHIVCHAEDHIDADLPPDAHKAAVLDYLDAHLSHPEVREAIAGWTDLAPSEKAALLSSIGHKFEYEGPCPLADGLARTVHEAGPGHGELGAVAPSRLAQDMLRSFGPEFVADLEDQPEASGLHGAALRVKASAHAPEVGDGLSATAVRSVVKSHLRQIQFCFEREVQRGPVRGGTFELRFVVDGNGQATKLEATSQADMSEATLACAKMRVSRWRFPKAEDSRGVDVAQRFDVVTER